MKKILITIVATVLVCACVVGGTVAWLTATTTPVTNTFTVGKIEITLTESIPTTDDDQTTDKYEFKMIPGAPITKDPTITVTSISENCFVYALVKNNTDGAIIIEMADGWNLVDGYSDLWVKEHTLGTESKFPVFKDNQVTVSTDVTAETNPSDIVITAFAVQSFGMTDAKDAWSKSGFTGATATNP